MIIKTSSQGASRAAVAALARHLLSNENEAAEVVELRGVVGPLADALEEMRAVSLGTRSRRPLLHASINVPPDEAARLTADQWGQAADTLENALGLAGHQRALVMHVKRDAKGQLRRHLHVVWNRVDAVSLKVVHDGWGFRKNEEVARTLELLWNLRAVTGVHTRPPGTPRPVARTQRTDHQAAKRNGTKLDDTIATLHRCWEQATTGQAFAAALEAAGQLSLASGHRGIVVVVAGVPHSLARRLGLRAEEVRRKLADLDPKTLPTVEQVQQAQKQRPQHRSTAMKSKPFGVARPRPRKRREAEARQPLTPDYWHDLGFEVETRPDMLIVWLAPDCRLEDRGDDISIYRPSGPTPEDTALIIAAAKARGWTGIRFHGGTAEWQQAARQAALAAGYAWDDISLECEDGLPKPPVSVISLPDHVRRCLLPAPEQPQEVLNQPSAPEPAPTPAPVFRP